MLGGGGPERQLSGGLLSLAGGLLSLAGGLLSRTLRVGVQPPAATSAAAPLQCACRCALTRSFTHPPAYPMTCLPNYLQSIVLAATFSVSHNVPESKPLQSGEQAAAWAAAAWAAAAPCLLQQRLSAQAPAGPTNPRTTACCLPSPPRPAGPTADNLYTELAERDWGVQQILTSANWGGVVGNFFTGGLNLQVEHHLFPAISFAHYPAIAAIVEDECRRRGVPYAKYDTLPQVSVVEGWAGLGWGWVGLVGGFAAGVPPSMLQCTALPCRPSPPPAQSGLQAATCSAAVLPRPCPSPGPP